MKQQYETQIRNMSQLAIVSNGSQGEVVIRCESLAGLEFFWSEDIELRNVGFVSCEVLQNNTIASELVKSSSNDLEVQLELFNSCKAIKLVDVQVNGSNGTVLFFITQWVWFQFIDACFLTL